MRCDNMPEFVAEVVRSWLKETGLGSLFVATGSSWQNGYSQSFHGEVRDEFLNPEDFEGEPQARASDALEGGASHGVPRRLHEISGAGRIRGES